MWDATKESAIVFFIGAVLLVCGCVSHSAISPAAPATSIASNPVQYGVTDNQPAEDSIYQYLPDSSYWIAINPVQNFRIGAGSGPDRILFNISGTTNLPVNSLLFIDVYRKNPSSGQEERDLLWNAVTPVKNNGEKNNTFFYAENVTKDFYNSTIKAADYRVVVRRYNVSAIGGFTILRKDPLPFIWIRIDPIEKHHWGDVFTITGTSNLPAGSEITVRNERYGAEFSTEYKCRNDVICARYYDCSNEGNFERKGPVIGTGREYNTWNITVDTTGWCINHTYKLTASKEEWDNVTPVSDVYSFYSKIPDEEANYQRNTKDIENLLNILK
jgi:hypothetical protein